MDGTQMTEYQLYCFAQSGNAYRAALMLNLIGADWEPLWLDFFGKGEQRTPEYRMNVNEMGEVPVLVHGARKLSQSAVILTYLAERSGKFRPASEDERLEALRWIIFDNQKVNGFLGPYRFLRSIAQPPGDPAVLAFLKGRIDNNLAIVDKRLSTRPFMLGQRPTIADLSLVAYLYYPAAEFGFDIAADHRNIAAWLERIKVLPGWKHPYDLMPGHPLTARLREGRSPLDQLRRAGLSGVCGCSGWVGDSAGDSLSTAACAPAREAACAAAAASLR
jgi:glutathione S-transferase